MKRHVWRRTGHVMCLLLIAAFLSPLPAKAGLGVELLSDPALKSAWTSAAITVSPALELSGASPTAITARTFTVEMSPSATQVFTAPQPLAGPPRWLADEAELEDGGRSASYWRVLGPVTLTLAVGTATWLLFTVRSR